MDTTTSLRFPCAFSREAVKHNNLITGVVLVPAILLFVYLCFSTGVWLMLVFAFFFIATLVFSQLYVKRLTTESYIEITADRRIKCVYKGRKPVYYPISEISSIEEATIRQAEKRYAIFPVALQTRGRDISPETGVLITFNRAWIKSVHPVFFNPADPVAFIAALRPSAGIQ